MNRIEIFAQNNATQLDYLVFGESSSPVACVPTYLLAAARSDAAVYCVGFSPEVRKKIAGELNGRSMTFGELLNVRR